MKTKIVVVLFTVLVIASLVSKSNCWHGSVAGRKRELKENLKVWNFVIFGKFFFSVLVMTLANDQNI